MSIPLCGRYSKYQLVITVVSNKTPISFSINVRPQASNYEEIVVDDDSDEDGDRDSDDADSDDGSGDEEYVAQQQQSSVELLFQLPSKYPEEKPSIEVIGSQNLEEDELAELLNILGQKAEESLGTVMVFMLVSDVIEWLITKSESDANEIEHEKELKQKEIEAEEKKRFEGTPVTEQTFLAWKAKFDAEMLKLALEQQKQQAEPSGAGVTRRLTGRAMFESDKTLAESDLNFVEDLDQNQLEALLHNIDEIDLEDDGDDEEFVLGEDDDEDDDIDSEELEESDEEEDKKTHNSTSKR